MVTENASATASAEASAKVVDLAAWRAARLRDRDELPLFAVEAGKTAVATRRTLSNAAVAHRELMLRHLQTAAAAAATGPLRQPDGC